MLERLKSLYTTLKPIFVLHYITDISLAAIYFLVKTCSPICDYLFDNCNLELRELEWLTFLGCVIVMKNRRQVGLKEYISTACMFGKVLNLVLFFKINAVYGMVYGIVCLLHLVFIPETVYRGPEYVTYFRGPHLEEELERDKRITWLIAFYAAWSPACVALAPSFAEISAEYQLDNLKFGKLDVSKFSKVGEKFNVNAGSLSKQLPTLILFQNGKEKERRPFISAKGTVVRFKFTKESIIQEFDLNNLYGQCKQQLKGKKDKTKTEKQE
ncbi:hypothetical protein ACJMK2_010960 [Sinanodonta woodiana]|uniref:Thioredoxin domain-containing protein n=1 Tax=Sinanodonta woodiana TaxID=1069815 RepID=A0ABD3V6N1_SINWO